MATDLLGGGARPGWAALVRVEGGDGVLTVVAVLGLQGLFEQPRQGVGGRAVRGRGGVLLSLGHGLRGAGPGTINWLCTISPAELVLTC